VQVDLQLLRIGNIRDTYGGTAWAMSANPRAPLLAVGCEDGVVRLFRYEPSSVGLSSAADMSGSYLANGASKNSTGSLEYSRSLPTSGSRVLSVAYHPTEKRIFAGCSDGSVRCMEEDSGRVLFRMLGDVLRGSVSTLIWSLLVLPDSTVVTGDSRGQVDTLHFTVFLVQDACARCVLTCLGQCIYYRVFVLTPIVVPSECRCKCGTARPAYSWTPSVSIPRMCSPWLQVPTARLSSRPAWTGRSSACRRYQRSVITTVQPLLMTGYVPCIGGEYG
jgi:hypothetical protein